MSDSSRVQLRFIEEVTFGEQPPNPGAAALNDMRFTGEALKQATEVTESQEIRSDRQVPDIVRTRVSSEGDVNIELSAASHDDILEGALFNTWGTLAPVTAQSIDVETNDTFAASSGTPFANAVVGQWIFTSGFTDAANNGFFKIASIPIAGTDVTVEQVLVTEIGTGDEAVQGQFLPNGTVLKSYYLEKEFSDLSNEFLQYHGCRVGQMTVTAAVGSILTGTFTFGGLGETGANATAGVGSPVTTSGAVMNAIDNIAGLREGGVEGGLDIEQVQFTIQNNLRPQSKLGQVFARGIGAGRVNVSGTLRAYFESRTLFEKYLNFTISEFAFRAIDAAGAGYVFDFPQLKFTDGQVLAEGIDRDVFAQMSWSAYLDPTYSVTAGVTRFPGV